jgi:chemotaxis protein histidine kinase CheA
MTDPSAQNPIIGDCPPPRESTTVFFFHFLHNDADDNNAANVQHIDEQNDAENASQQQPEENDERQTKRAQFSQKDASDHPQVQEDMRSETTTTTCPPSEPSKLFFTAMSFASPPSTPDGAPSHEALLQPPSVTAEATSSSAKEELKDEEEKHQHQKSGELHEEAKGGEGGAEADDSTSASSFVYIDELILADAQAYAANRKQTNRSHTTSQQEHHQDGDTWTSWEQLDTQTRFDVIASSARFVSSADEPHAVEVALSEAAFLARTEAGMGAAHLEPSVVPPVAQHHHDQHVLDGVAHILSRRVGTTVCCGMIAIETAIHCPPLVPVVFELGYLALPLINVVQTAGDLVTFLSSVSATPAAMAALRDGKRVFDRRSGLWVRVDLSVARRYLPPNDHDLLDKARREKARYRAHWGVPLPQAAQEAAYNERLDQSEADTPPSPPDDLFLVLGIQRDVSDEIVRRSYRLRAIQLHPDKNLTNPMAKEEFQKLQRAYEVLSTAEGRAQHRIELSLPPQPKRARRDPNQDRPSAEQYAEAYELCPLEKEVLPVALLPLTGRPLHLTIFHSSLLFYESLANEYRARQSLRVALHLEQLTSEGEEAVLQRLLRLCNVSEPLQLVTGHPHSRPTLALVGRILIAKSEAVLRKYGLMRRELSEATSKVASAWRAMWTTLVSLTKASWTSEVSWLFEPEKNVLQHDPDAADRKLLFEGAAVEMEQTVREACHYLFADADASDRMKQQRADRLFELGELLVTMSAPVSKDKK